MFTNYSLTMAVCVWYNIYRVKGEERKKKKTLTNKF